MRAYHHHETKTFIKYVPTYPWALLGPQHGWEMRSLGYRPCSGSMPCTVTYGFPPARRGHSKNNGLILHPMGSTGIMGHMVTGLVFFFVGASQWSCPVAPQGRSLLLRLLLRLLLHRGGPIAPLICPISLLINVMRQA